MKASDLARKIGVNSRTLRRWTDAGQVPCVRQKTKGGHYRYAQTAALTRWVEEKRAATGKIQVESRARGEAGRAEKPKQIASLLSRYSAKEIIRMVNEARGIGIQLQSEGVQRALSRAARIGKAPFDANISEMFAQLYHRN